MEAVCQHLNARYRIKNTQGAKRKPVASPASKLTIKSCDKQRKSIMLLLLKIVLLLIKNVFKHDKYLSVAVCGFVCK